MLFNVEVSSITFHHLCSSCNIQGNTENIFKERKRNIPESDDEHQEPSSETDSDIYMLPKKPKHWGYDLFNQGFKTILIVYVGMLIISG